MRGTANGTAALILAALWLLVGPASVLACSPPFEEPTIAALGPDQLVVVGTTGGPAPGGRLFHVERAWNGDVPTSPIVISFKEGEPVGDCSYPMEAGRRLVIAPYMEPNGRLSADLVTLQADPDSDTGRRYLAEARSLYGEGTVPVSVQPAPSPVGTGLIVAASLVIAIGALTLLATVVVRRDRGRRLA
jgi:hypothetical protein